MKKILILLAVAGILAACHTTKHVEKAETTIAIDSSFVADHNEVTTKTIVDTATTESGAITITEIEFFEPVIHDGDSTNLSGIPSGDSSFLSLDPSGNLSINGKIKGIKQTRIEKEKTSSGHKEKEEKTVQDNQVANVTHNEKATEVKKEIEREIFPLEYYLITIAVIVAVLFALWKRRYISTWFRKFLSNLAKIG